MHIEEYLTSIRYPWHSVSVVFRGGDYWLAESYGHKAIIYANMAKIIKICIYRSYSEEHGKLIRVETGASVEKKNHQHHLDFGDLVWCKAAGFQVS